MLILEIVDKINTSTNKPKKTPKEDPKIPVVYTLKANYPEGE